MDPRLVRLRPGGNETVAEATWRVVAWRRIGPAYGLYTLVSVALPLTFVSDKVPLWSMQRFAVVVFPAFMALATVVRSRLLVAVTATILAAGLCAYVVRWSLWYWVA